MTTKEDTSKWDIVKATQYGLMSRCKELVEAGFDVRTPDGDNITVLHWAAINNRIDLAKYYISLGAVVDVLGGDLLATPLHWAIREGHLGMVVLLMQFGADAGVRDAEGCAAIHAAVQCGHTHIVAYLIAKGTDPDLYDANGKTPLMWATWRTFGVDPTRTLLSLYASVNTKDLVQRNTPLHWACLSQNTNVIMLLLNAGADLDAKNGMDETALDIATHKKNVWITARLATARKEKGYDIGTDNFVNRLTSSKMFRQRATFTITFCVMFFVGFLLEVPISSWLVKAVILLLFYLSVYAVSMLCVTQNEVTHYLPLAVSMSTKFWVYATSLWCFYAHVYSPVSKLAHLLCSSAMFYFFYKSLKTDPGIISVAEDQKKRNIVQMAETGNFRLDSICSTCLIPKPLRSKHCAVTNRCVAKFDHYCPWVCNAVGSGNHRHFIAYLVFLLGVLVWNVSAAFQYWHNAVPSPVDMASLDKTWFRMKHSPWVVWIFANCVFHLCWVSILLACQLYQIVVMGVTTNERMNAERYQHFHTSKHGAVRSSPFNRGFFNNAADFFSCTCFGFLSPLRIDWRTKLDFPPEFTDFQLRSRTHENV